MVSAGNGNDDDEEETTSFAHTLTHTLKLREDWIATLKPFEENVIDSATKIRKMAPSSKKSYIFDPRNWRTRKDAAKSMAVCQKRLPSNRGILQSSPGRHHRQPSWPGYEFLSLTNVVMCWKTHVKFALFAKRRSFARPMKTISCQFPWKFMLLNSQTTSQELEGKENNCSLEYKVVTTTTNSTPSVISHLLFDTQRSLISHSHKRKIIRMAVKSYHKCVASTADHVFVIKLSKSVTFTPNDRMYRKGI